MSIYQSQIAVVIPCYKVGNGILDVLSQIGPEVSQIYVVDDACPYLTGEVVETFSTDTRVHVIRHTRNRGVGAAVKTGYLEALKKNPDILVKLDGDGQMDPNQIARLVSPILTNTADYSKGNRFKDTSVFREMPIMRLLGNLALTYVSRISSGYWKISDPNNGFTAISAKALRGLCFTKISDSYFFESDMIFNLALNKARIQDIAIPAIYSGGLSSLSISHSLIEFSYKHARNYSRRITRLIVESFKS